MAYNTPETVADYLARFQMEITHRGKGTFTPDHVKYSLTIASGGKDFFTTFESNPHVHGEPTITQVFGALASDAMVVRDYGMDEFVDEFCDGMKPSAAIRAYNSCKETYDWMRDGLYLSNGDIASLSEVISENEEEIGALVEKAASERAARYAYDHPKYLPGKELLAGEKHLFERHTLEALKEKLDGRDLHFETTVSKKQENPPLPYNLTVLLSDMSERFGFTAAETQQITQDLRDKYKAITYNRSDSQYLKEEHREQAPAVLAQAMKNLGVRWPLDYRLHSKAFNDGNVTAHHGIIPQEADAPVSAMEPDEAKVYTAICERYAVQFLPPAVYDVSESTVSVDGGTLKLTAKRLSDAGFTAVFPNISNSRVREDSDTGNPWVPAGSHTLAGISCSITEGETTPPAPYTEGTLITDMASIAKYVKDPEIREILKRKDDGKKGEHGGIGTTATRSSIIEGLKTRGYLEERKGKVRATDKAKAFYALLPPEIRGADVTARWWLIQQDIADGKADVNALQDSVIEVFNHHRETAYVGASIAGAGKTVVGKCPRCGKDVIKTGSIYACSSIKNEKQEDGTWKEVAGCGFKLFGFCTKKFTEKQAASLLDGKAVSLRGCKSKAGKTFDCTVVLQKDGSVEPIFTPRKPTKKGRR